MSNQLTMDHLVWYVLGLRLTQACIAFSYEPDETTAEDEFYHATLNRLLDAVLQLPEMEGNHILQEEVNDLRSTHRQWREVETEEDAFRAMRQIRAYLNSVIARSNSWTMQLDRPHLIWFQLGREIADGSADVLVNENQDGDSSATVEFREHKGGLWPQASFPVFSTVRWSWRRRDSINELLNQLSLELSDVFPDSDSDDHAVDSVSLLEEYPLELLGWERVEVGLQIMVNSVRFSASRLPRWDAQTRTLWVGNRSAKAFRRSAPNQFSVFENFERMGWPQEIESPFSSSQHDDTISGINERIDSRLIRFSGYGSTVIRYELGPEAFTETQ